MTDRSRTRASTRRALTGVLLVWVLALSAAPTATAEIANHPFRGTLIPRDASTPTPLNDPCGVAVNSISDIYVADYYNGTVGVRDHKKSTYSGIVGSPVPNGPCGLAVDAAANLYVNYWHSQVFKYLPDAYPPGENETVSYSGGGQISAGPATGIAVDPASGDLYVDERTSVAVYKAPILAGAAPAFRVGEGSIGDGYGVAVSAYGPTDGRVYVADAATDTVKVFDPAVDLDAPVAEIDGAGTAQGGFVSLTDSSLAIDQSNGHVFVSDNLQPGFEHPLAAVDEFNAQNLYRGALQHFLINGEPTGIAVNESATTRKGEVYVTSGNGTSNPAAQTDGNSVLYSFGPAGLGVVLSVNGSGTGDGTVTSQPAGIKCPGSCQAEFNAQRQVTLTATPAPGSAFAGWSGACTGTGTCQVTTSEATTVNAEFVPAPPALSAASIAVAPLAATADAPSEAEQSSFRVITASGRGGTVVLHAYAPAPGTVTAIGRGLQTARARIAEGGSAELRLRLSRKGLRALAHSKRGRLSTRVGLRFEPSFGGPDRVLRTIVSFNRPNRGKR
jgi:List-Bact-rpt repeat protein